MSTRAGILAVVIFGFLLVGLVQCFEQTPPDEGDYLEIGEVCETTEDCCPGWHCTDITGNDTWRCIRQKGS